MNAHAYNATPGAHVVGYVEADGRAYCADCTRTRAALAGYGDDVDANRVPLSYAGRIGHGVITTADTRSTRAACASCVRSLMSYDVWRRMTEAERAAVVDLSGLDPLLAPWKGWRVECTRYGERERFIVGRSTGWRPCLLAMKTRRSTGGDAITAGSVSDVRPLYKVKP